MNSEVKQLKDRLSQLTGQMDVPKFRLDSVNWLSRNLRRRNKEHPNFKEAEKIIKKLMAMGVR